MCNWATPLMVLLLWTAAAAAGDATLFRISKDDWNENSDIVSCVAWSPDGETIAASYGRFVGLLQESRPGQAILWDARTGNRRLALTGYTDGVSSVAFSPDGKTVAASGYVGELKLWDTRNGKLLRLIRAPGIIRSVAFSPEGAFLAAGLWSTKGGHDAGEARIWRAATGEEAARLTGHTDAVLSVAFSQGGRLLATGSRDGSARVWDVRTNRLQATLTCPKVIELARRKTESILRKRGQVYEPMPSVQSVAFSPDGRTLAAAFGEPVIPDTPEGVGAVQLWDMQKSKPAATISHHDRFVCQVTYSLNGGLLATAGKDGTVIVWDVNTLDGIAKVEGDAPIAFAPSGKQLIVTGDGALLRLTTIARPQAANTPQPQSKSPLDSADRGKMVH